MVMRTQTDVEQTVQAFTSAAEALRTHTISRVMVSLDHALLEDLQVEVEKLLRWLAEIEAEWNYSRRVLNGDE